MLWSSPPSTASAPVPAAAVPTAVAVYSFAGGAAPLFRLSGMPRHPAVDTDQCKASPGGVDRVGSYMIDCVRYALATICLMIALTVALGLYATWYHVFPTSESDWS